MRTNYYEAIIQIRPKNKDLLDFTLEQIDSYGMNISRTIDKKYGCDFYVDSRKKTVRVMKNISKKFKGTLTVSKSFYGVDRQKGKEIYRLTICFRLK